MPRITAASSVAIRLRHLAPRIHGKGARPLYELLRELAAKSSAVIDCAEVYAAMNEEVLDYFGGRDLPPVILRRVK